MNDETLVLAIDDDPEALDLVRRAVRPKPWTVKAFMNVVDVQEWLREQPEGIVPADAAILDLNLEAEGSGFAVLQALAVRGIPVAVVSGRVGQKERAVAITAGATAVLSKPVTPAELRAWIETVAGNGNRRRGAVRLPNGWLLGRNGEIKPPPGQSGGAVSLTPTQAKLLRLLAVGGVRGVPKREAMQLSQSLTALRVQISRLRPVIAPLGLDVRTENDTLYLVETHG